MEKLSCFVIMPSNSADNSSVRLLHDKKRGLVEFPSGCKEAISSNQIVDLDYLEVYNQIIKSAIEKINHDFKEKEIQIECIRAQDLPEAGDIIGQIVRHICTADITITDITSNNPNVFLEYGIRLSIHDELNIMICHETDEKNIPFDVQKLRCIFYNTSVKKANQARDEIYKFIASFIQKKLQDKKSSLSHKISYNSETSSLYKKLVEVYTGRQIEQELISILRNAPLIIKNLASYLFTHKKKMGMEIELYKFLEALGGVLEKDPKGKNQAIEFYELISTIEGLKKEKMMEIYYNLAMLCDEVPVLKFKAESYRKKLAELEA